MIKKIKLIIFILLKYFNLVKIDYKSNIKVNFGCDESNDFFIKKLKNSNFYLEYGSGNSTLIADSLNKEFISIESDKHFFNFIKEKIKKKENLRLKSFGITGDYSTPLMFNITKNFLKTKIKRYVSDVLNEFEVLKRYPDLILIDGRFRVLCALSLHKFFLKKKEKPLIIVDDYKFRYDYHILSKFFTIKIIGRFGVLENFLEVDTKDFIEKYIVDHN